LLFCAPLLVFAQDDEIIDLNDPDTLFNQEITTETEDVPVEPDPDDSATILEEIISSETFELHGGINLLAGYSGGWESHPFHQDFVMSDYIDSGVIEMASWLKLKTRISPALQMVCKVTFEYPGFAFDLSECFIEYNLLDTFFLTAGRQTVNWGTSRFYPFTNLPARMPDIFPKTAGTTDSDKPFLIKGNLPVGIGGFTAMAYSRRGYFEVVGTPELSEMGYGFLYNGAFNNLDFTVGAWWQEMLDTRLVWWLGTTLFDKVDLYTEGLITLYEDNSLAFDANLGFLFELMQRKIQITGEYCYIGEEVNLDMFDRDYDLVPGHNLAAGVSWKLFRNKIRLYAQFLYNIDSDTGLLLPGATFDFFNNLTFGFHLPVILGPDTGEYFINNPDKKDRRFFFAATIRIKGNF
jgi:hypothetical protein